jgi:hypothetical protein
MVKLFRLFFIAYVCFVNIGCTDDSPAACSEIEQLDSEIEINGERLLLQKAEVRENTTSLLDTYEFLIDAVGSDCDQLLKFRFYASVPISENLEGDFTVVESSVYTAYQITSFTYTVETIEPNSFDIVYAVNGEGKITEHSENEYSIDIKAELPDNKEVDFNLRFQF